MGISLALQLNPNFVEIDLDLKNAHTFSSRDKVEEEMESDVIDHYLLEVFRSLYGKTATSSGTMGTDLIALLQVCTCRRMASDR